MIERLAPTTRVIRPLTFAYTRPLSPTDLSGITGLLSDTSPQAPGLPPTLIKKLAQRFKDWLNG